MFGEILSKFEIHEKNANNLEIFFYLYKRPLTRNLVLNFKPVCLESKSINILRNNLIIIK